MVKKRRIIRVAELTIETEEKTVIRRGSVYPVSRSVRRGGNETDAAAKRAHVPGSPGDAHREKGNG